MATYTSADFGFLLADGFSLLGTVTALNDSVEAILEEIHALGDEWFKFGSPGIRKGALSQSGFYDAAAGQVNAMLANQEGASRILCWCTEKNLLGATFIGYQGALQAKYDRVVELDKFHKANAVYNPSGNIDRGQVLHIHKTETGASWSGAGVDNASAALKGCAVPVVGNTAADPAHIITTVPHGLVTGDVVLISDLVGAVPDLNGEHVITYVSDTEFSIPVAVSVGGTGGYLVQADSDNGGAAYLEVSALALGGYTNAAITVKHSTDNATWVTLASFVAVTLAPSAQRVLVAAGTKVNRYLQDAGAFTGAGSAQSIKYMSGFARL
ncbi:MAG: hypothetical protein ABFD60_01595 [Bryobacteraceae bacterium]